MRYRRDKRNEFALAILVLALSWIAPAAAQQTRSGDTNPAPRYKTSTDPTEAAACRERLQLIHDAITSFRAAQNRLPHWLSELSPEYLDAKLLVCPYVKKIADLKSWRLGFRDDVFQDPKESTSYAYEFCNKEMILWTGVKKTWSEYKQRVMGRMGSVGTDAVPIVRCFAHEPVLNLAYGGRIYSNPGDRDWESLYEPEFKHEDLHPEPLFFHEPPKTNLKRFPKRAADADDRLLDLSPHYNAYLDEPWLPYPRDSDLKGLPHGTREFGGVRFDVRGLIQLNGDQLLAPYPIFVGRIKVGRACKKVHFLHGARPIYVPTDHFQAVKILEGTKVAAYVAHYQSGAQVEIPILYGRDVKDWWYDPGFADHDPARVVWEGENPASIGLHRKIRLFFTSWDNPWEDQPIESLSLVSAMAKTAPFVIAITVE